MKYYVEEISVLKDGTSAHTITEKESKEKALSDFHLTLAYGYLNKDIETMHVEAKDAIGMIIGSETITTQEKE